MQKTLSNPHISVEFRVEGWHRWPDAPPHRAYLAASHRHMFQVFAALEVRHDDREVELHDFLDFCKRHLPPGDFGAASCEALARRLIDAILADYPGRHTYVEVLEDGEAGAYLYTTGDD